MPRLKFALFDQQLENLAKNRFRYVSKREVFCGGDRLETCFINFDGVPYSYDEHHLSFEASEFAAKWLKQRFPEWQDLISSSLPPK